MEWMAPSLEERIKLAPSGDVERPRKYSRAALLGGSGEVRVRNWRISPAADSASEVIVFGLERKIYSVANKAVNKTTTTSVTSSVC